MRTAGWVVGLAAGALTMFLVSAGAAGPTAVRFLAFMAGQAAFLACGSVLFIRLYDYLLGRAGRSVLGVPLAAISARRRLFAWMHVAAFGAVVAFALLAYVGPEAQSSLLAAIRRSAQNPHSPLGMAAAAYGSGSVLLAAAVTLMVNFVVGALLTITLPSLILPGAGALLVFLRACVLGLALAPTSPKLFHAMVWHMGTVLVEMEAYILSAFFGLMVPIYILSPQEGETGLARYLKALKLNARGALLALAVLAVAALYEAVEVLAQMPWRPGPPVA